MKARHIDNSLFSGETPLRTLSLALVMPQPTTPEPEPSKPDLNATGVLRAQPGDTRFETDFGQLAARFASQSGGGLSQELSADLALEIVLNEVVEQACLTTGATGAAIALERDGEMVCRASSGATAPALGSRMDSAAGLSGECIRTRQTQRCDDVLGDPRVDLEAAQRMGVRSAMVMPLIREDQAIGLFEAFASLPKAFGKRDELTLEALALRILSNLESAAGPLQPENVPLPIPEIQIPESQPIVPEIPENFFPESVREIPEGGSPPGGFDFVTWSLRVAVLVCAVMLGLLLGRHLGTPKAMGRPHSVVPQSAAADASATISPPVDASPPGKQEASNPPRATFSKGGEKPVPPGSLLVFENGKEIFRMPPMQNGPGQKQVAQNQAASATPGVGDGVQRASSQEPEKSAEPGKEDDLSSAMAEGSVLNRVEPRYPEEAVQEKIQGAVVLNVHIGPDGAVQDVKVISGPPELAQASTDAVKQWRFRPRRVNGRAVPMQTKITLNYRLPQ